MGTWRVRTRTHAPTHIYTVLVIVVIAEIRSHPVPTRPRVPIPPPPRLSMYTARALRHNVYARRPPRAFILHNDCQRSLAARAPPPRSTRIIIIPWLRVEALFGYIDSTRCSAPNTKGGGGKGYFESQIWAVLRWHNCNEKTEGVVSLLFFQFVHKWHKVWLTRVLFLRRWRC